MPPVIDYKKCKRCGTCDNHCPGDVIQVHCHPDVADLMRGPEQPAVDDTVKRVQRAIEIHARKGFHVEQFEIKGKVPPGKARGPAQD